MPLAVREVSATVTHRSTDHAACDADADQQWLHGMLGCRVGCLHRILRHLASGGMGHVFLTEHVHLGAHAAVKVARPGVPSARCVIEREAVLLSQLQHPNIVGVLDTGTLRDYLPYVLMEYVGGIELDSFIDSCGSMRPERSIGILKQVASAVDYMHERGVVHADIKPANVIFDPRAHDFAKLVDFGIAYHVGTKRPHIGLVGTPAYMAPEQARAQASGTAVDLYGVAALALELLTGRPPYDRDSPQATVTAVLTEAPAMPSTRGVRADGLDAVFAKGLHRDPAQRYATAREFVAALEHVFAPAEGPASVTASVAVDKATELQRGSRLAVRSVTDPRAATVRCRSGWHARASGSRQAARRVLAAAVGALVALLPNV